MSRRSKDAEHEAIAQWNRLTPREQNETVRTAAHLLTREGMHRLGPHVLGVAFGGRKKRLRARGKTKTDLLHECPTLVVVVARKLPKSRLRGGRGARLVPKFVVVTADIGYRKNVDVAVPTDVITMPRRPRAQTVEGLHMENLAQDLRLNGSVAAVVRDVPESGERYFLTCHHVACLSLLDANLHARLPAEAFLLPSNALIGGADREAFFGAGVGPCIDAALVRINLDAPGADLSLLTPLNGFVSSFDQLQTERELAGISLFSRHQTRGAAVDFQRIHVNLDVRYESGAVATIHEVMEYQMAGGQTQGGDSGGALVSGNGVFMGMHIAGAGSTGFGIPAYMLLDSPAFDPHITLA